MAEWIDTANVWLRAAVALGAGLAAGLLAAAVLSSVARRIASRTRVAADDLLVRHLRGPLLLASSLLAGLAGVATAVDTPPVPLVHGLRVLVIASAGWAVARLTRAGEDLVMGRLALDARDNLRARSIETQVRVLRRIALFGIAVVTVGIALLTFDPLRRLGAGLLTSAGILGIIVGFAAQKTLGNLIAGIQIALTQPIRLDDVVVVEGEWGWIEEITLTYVVVRIWDLRRLVLPISYFIEHPFENWTRTSADLLATVYLRLDPRVDFDGLREELGRLLEASSHWDGKVQRLHVTGADANGVEVRALMSAEDSPSAWELRCEVREGLVRWVARHHPEALPRVRAEVGALGSES